MFTKTSIVLLFCFIASSFASTCEKPEVQVKPFTTQDARIVSQIAFIAEFSLKCANSGPQDYPLFAEVAGKIAPVVRIGENNYQVSWSEDVKKAKSGNQEVRLFDETGYAAVKKAQRSGEKTNAVKPMTTFSFYHSGAYNGALINSEFLAVGAAVVCTYVALTSRSKLVN